MLDQITHVHLIGIGGAGLSAIARVLAQRGHTVSGSDMQLSPLARQLQAEGITVFAGHAAEHVAGAQLVVRSSAITDDNPEVVAAHQAGIPVLKRRDFLGPLMAGHVNIAIAGAHGKTTTTAMTAWLLHSTGQDPSFIAGGVLADLQTNARYGRGSAFVIEADEYDYMFLGLNPTVAVITNIEHDHPDMFPTVDDTLRAFGEFAAHVPATGRLIACYDDPLARQLAASLNVPVATYGLDDGADWRAEMVRANPASGGSDFLVTHQGSTHGLASIGLPGEHNVRNALAAIAVCHYLGLSLSDLRPALRSFTGAGRRFEIKGEVNGVTIVDDYAHHPTEIRATLAGARARFGDRPIWAVFQPHTFSRTRAMLLDFAASFGQANHVLVTDIYRAREIDDGVVRAQDVVARMDLHPDARYAGSLDQTVQVLTAELQPGDVLITLSAGDAYQVGERVLAALQARQN